MPSLVIKHLMLILLVQYCKNTSLVGSTVKLQLRNGLVCNTTNNIPKKI